MNMKKILNIFACLTVVLGLAACSESFLETAPTSSYAEDFVLSSVDNLEAALNGTHKSMVAQYLSRQNIGGYPSFQIAMDRQRLVDQHRRGEVDCYPQPRRLLDLLSLASLLQVDLQRQHDPFGH